MPNPVWPPSLPQHVETPDLENTFPDSAVRTKMDAGPGKARRRFTAAPEPIKAAIIVTAAQLATLKTFFVTTLASGALRFDWVHPITQAAATFRFRGAPQVKALGNSGGGVAMTKVTLDLEIVP